MAYVNPGDAFSGGFTDALKRQDDIKRRALLDKLAMDREQRLAQAEMDAAHDRQQKLHDYQVDRATAAADREAALKEKVAKDFSADIEKRYLPGDFASAEDIARAKELGVQIPGGVRVADQPGQPMVGPQQDGSEPGSVMTAPVPGGIRYGGTAAQRMDVQRQQMRKDFADKLRAGSDPKETIASYLEAGGDPKEAEGIITALRPKTQQILRQHPTTGAIEEYHPATQSYTPLSGEVQPGAHWMTDKPEKPENTSARDKAYESAVKVFDAASKPIQGHIDGINEVSAMLGIHSPQADTLIAPLLLKATVSGQGSGFRMTRAEIDNVLHGRSKWEDLQAAIQKWNTDPSKANQLTDSQRQQMRDLVTMIRAKAAGAMQRITALQDQLDLATTPEQIHRLRTELKKQQAQMSGDDEESKTGGVPAVGGIFNGGKVVKVTPVKD